MLYDFRKLYANWIVVWLFRGTVLLLCNYVSVGKITMISIAFTHEHSVFWRIFRVSSLFPDEKMFRCRTSRQPADCCSFRIARRKSELPKERKWSTQIMRDEKRLTETMMMQMVSIKLSKNWSNTRAGKIRKNIKRGSGAESLIFWKIFLLPLP